MLIAHYCVVMCIKSALTAESFEVAASIGSGIKSKHWPSSASADSEHMQEHISIENERERERVMCKVKFVCIRDANSYPHRRSAEPSRIPSTVGFRLFIFRKQRPRRRRFVHACKPRQRERARDALKASNKVKRLFVVGKPQSLWRVDSIYQQNALLIEKKFHH